MTKSQISAILKSVGEVENDFIDFSKTNVTMINISKYEVRFIDPTQLHFYFDSEKELLKVYPCKKLPNGEIRYLLDKNGDKIYDTYSYFAIQEFLFGKEGQY